MIQTWNHLKISTFGEVIYISIFTHYRGIQIYIRNKCVLNINQERDNIFRLVADVDFSQLTLL